MMEPLPERGEGDCQPLLLQALIEKNQRVLCTYKAKKDVVTIQNIGHMLKMCRWWQHLSWQCPGGVAMLVNFGKCGLGRFSHPLKPLKHCPDEVWKHKNDSIVLASNMNKTPKLFWKHLPAPPNLRRSSSMDLHHLEIKPRKIWDPKHFWMESRSFLASPWGFPTMCLNVAWVILGVFLTYSKNPGLSKINCANL